MPEPKGSKPWRDPAMINYGEPVKTISASLIAAKGLCEAGRKCFRKNGHIGDCFPLDARRDPDQDVWSYLDGAGRAEGVTP